MRLRLTLILTGILAVFVLLWAMWPSPISPAYWDEPEAPAMTGPLEPGNALASADILDVGDPGATEGVAVAENGEVYFGTPDGRIRRFRPGTTAGAEDVAQLTGGKILGLDWLRPGLLGVTSVQGLHALDVESGDNTLVSSGAPAHPFGFAYDIAALPDGRIFFTDPTTRWGHDSNSSGFYYDLLENRPNGALYVWDPATHQTRLVRSRLFHPKGLELAPDGRSIFIVEAFRYRILRVWIDGPQAGEVDVFADNLPGIADAITIDAGGRLLVTMPGHRSEALAFLHRHPRVTQLVMKLPSWVSTGPHTARSFILELDPETGEPLDSWHDPDSRLGYLSHITTAPDGALWMGTSDRGHLVRYRLPARSDTGPDSGEIAGR